MADWAAVAEVFSLGRVLGIPEYVARGFMGEVWRLDTADGRWAVKWQFPWAAAEPLPPDVAIQLAAARAGIPLPLPVTAATGAAVARIGDRHARVYEWADLGPPPAVPVDVATAAEAGRLLGILHGLRLPPGGPQDPWYTATGPASDWPALIARGEAAGAPWAAGLAAARGLIEELRAHVAPAADGALQACHRDFYPDNVLPAGPKGRLMVLDWENAGPLDPERELGMAVFGWCTGGGRFDPAAADAMVAEYANAAGTAPELGPGLFATAVATHLNLLQAMAEQWLGESDDHAHAAAAIADIVDEYLADLRVVTAMPAAAWPFAARAARLAH